MQEQGCFMQRTSAFRKTTQTKHLDRWRPSDPVSLSEAARGRAGYQPPRGKDGRTLGPSPGAWNLPSPEEKPCRADRATETVCSHPGAEGGDMCIKYVLK